MNYKKILSCCALVALVATPAFHTSIAQPTLIAGVGHHGHVNQMTILAGAYFPVVGALQAGGDFRYLLGKEVDEGDETAFTVNINGRYPFVDDNNVQVFGVAGFNYYSWKWEGEFFGETFDESGNESGLNIGAVAQYNLGSLGVGADVKIVVNSDSSPLVVAVFLSKTLN